MFGDSYQICNISLGKTLCPRPDVRPCQDICKEISPERTNCSHSFFSKAKQPYLIVIGLTRAAHFDPEQNLCSQSFFGPSRYLIQRDDQGDIAAGRAWCLLLLGSLLFLAGAAGQELLAASGDHPATFETLKNGTVVSRRLFLLSCFYSLPYL